MFVIIFSAWQGDVRRKVNVICYFLLHCELHFGMVFHLHDWASNIHTMVVYLFNSLWMEWLHLFSLDRVI